MGNKREQGTQGEDIAAEFLTAKGYRIVERNYRFHETGEIDIIAFDPSIEQTVFVEVKMKTSLEYGEPEYSITDKKKLQVKRLAKCYIFEKNLVNIYGRFDVIAITKLPGKPIQINHHINAFE